MREFTDLEVWQGAHRLTLLIYRTTARYPREELFGLTRQTREAIVSVEANIAEGHGRFRDREFYRFCQIANGSLAETRCHPMVARDLEYLTSADWRKLECQALLVRRLLHGLLRRLETSPPSPSPEP
jgi:four helix bundle protein